MRRSPGGTLSLLEPPRDSVGLGSWTPALAGPLALSVMTGLIARPHSHGDVPSRSLVVTVGNEVNGAGPYPQRPRPRNAVVTAWFGHAPLRLGRVR